MASQRNRTGKTRLSSLSQRLTFERLEDRLVFAVQLDVGPIPDVVTVSPAAQPNQFDVSTGPILAATNWAAWPSTFAGQAIYQTSAANVRVESPNYIAVDLNKMYALSGWARSGDEFGQRYQANNLQSLGFASYDRDHLQILPQHVLRFAGAADTTLAAPLNPGATTIQLTNAGGWSNSAGAAEGTRGLAWYGYQDSTGATYSDYTYTRNTAMGGANGLWLPGAVTGNVITLASPWSGPALPAGTAVRNTGVGSDEAFVALDSQSVPGDWTWTQYAGVFGGQLLQSGSDSLTRFRPGTAYIRPVILVNEHGATGNLISWGDVNVSEVAAGTTAAQLGPKIVDLSVIIGADQRYALTPATSTWGESLVKVTTSSRYTMSGRALNLSENEERPLGFVSFDVDKKLIQSLHVSKYGVAADTTLAATLAPGDTSILVTNAAGWSNDAFESAETRALAWYGYTDSTGQTYANYTYTRNVAFDFDNGLWRPGAIFYDSNAGAYRINLVNPWTGPVLAAGATIRNATAGDVRNEPRVSPNVDTRGDWVEYAATIGGGVWQSGARNEESFRPGTAYIQSLFTNTASSGDIVIAPVGSPVATSSAAMLADRRVDIELDVVAKNALNTAGTFLASDYNRNGAVDAADYVLWRKTAGATGLTPFSGADGNGDGKVDQADLQLWRTNSGRSILAIESVVAEYGLASVVEGANGKVIRYQSDAWFVGADIVTYTLRNTLTNETFASSVTVQVLGGNEAQSATVMTTLATQAQTPGNVAPKAKDDYSIYTTIAGRTLSADGVRNVGLLANDTDAGSTLVTRLLEGPSHGSLKLNYDGTFEYTPAAGFIGTDSFKYEAFDGQFSETAVASISVRATDDELLLNNLRSIGIAALNYESAYKILPAWGAAISDANGNPYLSWRVFLLPYLGFQSLYNQFHLNEPWDSANNLPLASKMPDIFRDPSDAGTSTTTRLQTISGEGAPYYWRRTTGLLGGPKLQNVTDGTTNTFFAIETGADRAVTWTRPDPLDFNPNNPLASLGTLSSDSFRAVTISGSAVTLPASIDADTFEALVTVSGGESVDLAEYRRQFAEDTGGEAALAAYAASTESVMRSIGIAMQNYHDTKKMFPVASTASHFDANGKPFLSWRVHLLPFLEQTTLYNKFRLDEPWNSANNLPLLAEMPDIFRSAGDSAGSTTTRFVTLTGPDAAFGYQAAGQRQSGPSIINFTDGEWNTILFFEAGTNKAVDWTRPEDSPFDKNNPLASLGTSPDGKFRFAFADSHVATFSSDISAEVFSALATRRGGEMVDAGTEFARELARLGVNRTSAATVNNFRLAMIGMQEHRSVNGIFPIRSGTGYFDANGMPLLSWRVHLLPYVGYNALYQKFRLNEPWDSPNNLPLLAEMPDIYRSAGDPWDGVTTRMLEFTGPGAAFLSKTSGNQTGPAINTITDGSSNTIALVEGGAGAAVPWTKPTDVPFYANNPFSPLGDVGPNFVMSFFDASTFTKASTMSIELLKAYITPKGGEDVANPPTIPNVPGIYVAQSGGNTALNEFGADAFDIVLDKAPSSDVVIGVSVSDMAVAMLDKMMLTFTSANWNLPQRVYLRGVDNFVMNADQTVSVTVDVIDALSDDNYDPLAAPVFSATVKNDDFAPADYDRNGLVQEADYTTWRANFGGNANSSLEADGNRNGVVDAGDYVFWRKTVPASGAGAEVAVVPAAAGADVESTNGPESTVVALDEVFASVSASVLSDARFVRVTRDSGSASVGRSVWADELLLAMSGQREPSSAADAGAAFAEFNEDAEEDDAAAFESAFDACWNSFA